MTRTPAHTHQHETTPIPVQSIRLMWDALFPGLPVPPDVVEVTVTGGEVVVTRLVRNEDGFEYPAGDVEAVRPCRASTHYPVG